MISMRTSTGALMKAIREAHVAVSRGPSSSSAAKARQPLDLGVHVVHLDAEVLRPQWAFGVLRRPSPR